MRPIDHKTVVVLDRSWAFGENDGTDFELRIKEGAKLRSIGTCQKTIWSWCLEGILEMHRVLTDVYPDGEHLLRFAAIDYVGKMLDTEWGEKMVNRADLLTLMATIECPVAKEDEPIIRSGGLTMAIEALATETPMQKERHDKAKKAFEAKSEGQRFSEEVPKAIFEDDEPRRASLVVYTRFMKDEEIEELEEEIAQLVESRNKIAAQPSNKLFRPITRLRLYFINLYAESETCEVTTRPLRVNPKHPVVKSYVVSRKAVHMPAAIHSLLITGFQMASTTVANIPMKEENRGSSNYDVELFHRNSSHNILMSIEGLDHLQINTKAYAKEGVTYESMKLTWATTPKSKWNLFPHHREAYPCTPTEVTRPSACLKQFVMDGRSVLLDLERKGGLTKVPFNVAGKYLISHMLIVNSGRIFIHSIDIIHMFRKRPKYDIQKPIPIKPSQQSKNPNIEMLKHVFGQMRLDKFEKPILAKGEIKKETLKICPVEKAKARLKRITRNMPLYSEDTIVFQPGVKKHFEPLLTLITKWVLTEVDVENCNANILKLLQKRDQRVPLVPANSDLKLACVKDMTDTAEQMRVGLIEMARLLANYAQSSDKHRNIYDTFVETLGIDKLVKIEPDDIIPPSNPKLMKFDFSYLDEDTDESDPELYEDEQDRVYMERIRKAGNPSYFEELKENGEEDPSWCRPGEAFLRRKKVKADAKREKDEMVVVKSMIGKPVSIDLMEIMCERLDKEISKTRREFVGREEQGNVAKLYPNLATPAANARGATPPADDRKRTERGGSGTPPPAKFPRY